MGLPGIAQQLLLLFRRRLGLLPGFITPPLLFVFAIWLNYYLLLRARAARRRYGYYAAGRVTPGYYYAGLGLLRYYAAAAINIIIAIAARILLFRQAGAIAGASGLLPPITGGQPPAVCRVRHIIIAAGLQVYAAGARLLPFVRATHHTFNHHLLLHPLFTRRLGTIILFAGFRRSRVFSPLFSPPFIGRWVGVRSPLWPFRAPAVRPWASGHRRPDRPSSSCPLSIISRRRYPVFVIVILLLLDPSTHFSSSGPISPPDWPCSSHRLTVICHFIAFVIWPWHPDCPLTVHPSPPFWVIIRPSPHRARPGSHRDCCQGQGQTRPAARRCQARLLATVVVVDRPPADRSGNFADRSRPPFAPLSRIQVSSSRPLSSLHPDRPLSLHISRSPPYPHRFSPAARVPSGAPPFIVHHPYQVQVNHPHHHLLSHLLTSWSWQPPDFFFFYAAGAGSCQSVRSGCRHLPPLSGHRQLAVCC